MGEPEPRTVVSGLVNYIVRPWLLLLCELETSQADLDSCSCSAHRRDEKQVSYRSLQFEAGEHEGRQVVCDGLSCMPFPPKHDDSKLILHINASRLHPKMAKEEWALLSSSLLQKEAIQVTEYSLKTMNTQQH